MQGDRPIVHVHARRWVLRVESYVLVIGVYARMKRLKVSTRAATTSTQPPDISTHVDARHRCMHACEICMCCGRAQRHLLFQFCSPHCQLPRMSICAASGCRARPRRLKQVAYIPTYRHAVVLLSLHKTQPRVTVGADGCDRSIYPSNAHARAHRSVIACETVYVLVLG